MRLRPPSCARRSLTAWAAAWLLGSGMGQALAQTTDADGLRRGDGLLSLEYQSVRVPGDQALDLAGLHAYHRLSERLAVGAGFYAPLVKGQYGGFVAADIGLQLRQRLGAGWWLTGGVSAGGGGGGRSVEHSKLLSGTGGFVKAEAGLAHELGPVTLGAGVSRLKFRHSLIDGTQARIYLEMPFSYLTGPYDRHGQPLPAAAEAQAASEAGESLVTLSLDNYRQQHPQGSNHRTISLADLQYSRFFAPDSYWFASLGMGVHGLPLYNQLLGGIGQRWRLDSGLTLCAQLGLGSGGYAPDVIDTGPGLLLYPRLLAEMPLTRDLGLSLSVGHLSAPKGSSRNTSYGLALTQHFGTARAGSEPAHYQGLRVSLFHQTENHLRYRDTDRPALQMLGLQMDLPVSERLYLPLQASGAYTAYLGYPGYAEILTGLGLQSRLSPGERLQAFGQALVGANVHGKAAKLSVGGRYVLDERLALHASLGRTEARSAAGNHFSATAVTLGLDWRFAVPTR